MPSTSRSAPGISQLIVGAYTAPMGGGLGVSAFTAAASDADTVELVAGRPVPLESPSYLIRHPTLPWIYAITESGPTTVVALRLDPDGTLTPEPPVGGSGDGACHLCLDPAARFVLVANYGSGSVSSFPVRADGSLGAEVDLYQLSGSGPDTERQEAPHAHQVVLDGDEILVPDLGTDLVHRLRIDDAGRLSRAAAPVSLPAGSGPRHLVVVGEHLVVACELSAELWVARRDGSGWASGTSVPASAAQPAERIYPSALVAHGEQVFVANRGSGTIAVFDLPDAAAPPRVSDAGARSNLSDTGAQLSMRVELDCGGSWPRDLVVTDSHLWVANQTDDTVVVIARADLEAPRIDFVVPTASPACIVL
ncbi:MAG: 6-phosphogluconolactonase, partial [Propionibacteriaceae bacterium]|nr:6-phosphogluconolactonase [Propionibacteriaceae bacterium]